MANQWCYENVCSENACGKNACGKDICNDTTRHEEIKWWVLNAIKSVLKREEGD